MRRADASMDLLRSVTEGALEPEYATTSAPRRSRFLRVLIITVIVGLLTYAFVQTFANRDLLASARDDLLTQVADARAYQDELSERIAAAEQEINDHRARLLPDPSSRDELAQLELSTGSVAVEGPGVVIVVDDNPNASGVEGRVLDSDLHQLVNGLFAAGAEAVAINGHRVTALTPIRSAGSAITVDYVSLSPPYEIEAIGSPESLPAAFGQTQAAAWWHYLRANYGLTLDLTTSDGDLSLAADPGMTLRHAREG